MKASAVSRLLLVSSAVLCLAALFHAPSSATVPPQLAQPADMTVDEGATADQTLTGIDPDGDPLTFSKVLGPTFITVTTTNPGTGTAAGNVHLAPGFRDNGIYSPTVGVSD